jgi:outer membrane protein assembly factor BamB
LDAIFSGVLVAARGMLVAGVVAAVAGVPAPAAVAAAATGLAASPWPGMRHDSRNTGLSPIVARYHGDRPWAYRTGRGIFSTPVIGPDGTIYVGSADTYFYAIGADGRLRWRIKTGGIIDAGAALSAPGGGSGGGSPTLTFGSADERLYHVTTAHKVLWRFRPTVAPVKGQQVNWWEGPVAIGPNGNIYAGNTGGTAYAVTPGGRLAWKFTAGGSLWTEPAFGPDGSSYWGSLDLNIYRLDQNGHPVWHTFTPGFVISSPALGSDGTVYIGSFDSKLYALDPQTGTPRWTFATSDHIYASPALDQDAAGHTTGIYIASADGSVYALTPTGRLRWRYDTGDPIRSSPTLGAKPAGERGRVLYVGSSNGKLYAIDTATGRRRWSYDTTPDDPVLRDRNDLNASPSLGRTGVYIAGEHGFVDYVPYDYCLHRADRRCSTSPSQDLGDNLDRVFPVTPGGTTLATTKRGGVSPATVINLRLVVRRHGRTVNAAILDPRHAVTATPRFASDIRESGDGHFLYVIPRGTLRAGTRYRLHVAGAYTDNGSNMGNFDPHGSPAGRFNQTITLATARAARSTGARLPLRTGAEAVSAITIRRLAVPMPAFLPSVNQIGFDSYDWIASTIARTRNHVLVWVIGAVADARGVERVDPRSAFAFPMRGQYAGRALALSSTNVSLEFSFGPAPLRRFEMRGTLTPQGSFEPGAALYAETVCATVPNYGPLLKFTGICNPDGLLASSGTFTSSPYVGSAAHAPPGLRLTRLSLTRPTARTSGVVVARLAGRLPDRRHHVAAILLTDARTGVPLSLNYRNQTSLHTTAAGRIDAVDLKLPSGTRLPTHARAYVIIDAFPLASRRL